MFDPVEGCILFVKDVYECFKSVFTVALRQLYRTVKLLFRAVKNLYTWKDQASVQEEVRDLFDNIEEACTCLEKNSGEDIKTQTSRPVASWFLLMKAIEMFWGPRNRITTRTLKTRSASLLKYFKNRKKDVDRESKI